MTLKNIPSTNPHKLSAERVAKAVKKTIKRLIQSGVLQPPATTQIVKTPEPTAPAEKPKLALVPPASKNELVSSEPFSLDIVEPVPPYFVVHNGGLAPKEETPDSPNTEPSAPASSTR